jgi:chromosome segregation ATPase
MHVDAATLGAVGVIIVGLATAAGAWIGKRGENRVSQSGAVLGGYSSLVDNLQEERDKAQQHLAENEVRLAAAYAELAGERAGKAELLTQITELTTENARLHARISELGGTPL